MTRVACWVVPINDFEVGHGWAVRTNTEIGVVMIPFGDNPLDVITAPRREFPTGCAMYLPEEFVYDR